MFFSYKPSEISWPGGQRAAGSKWATRLMLEHFPALPNAPRSDQTSPAKTRLTLIELEPKRALVEGGCVLLRNLGLESNIHYIYSSTMFT